MRSSYSFLHVFLIAALGMAALSLSVSASELDLDGVPATLADTRIGL